jgi:hypothetical protein
MVHLTIDVFTLQSGLSEITFVPWPVELPSLAFLAVGIKQFVVNAFSPLPLGLVPLPIWLWAAQLGNVAIDKGYIEQKGPAKRLPRAAAKRMFIGII